MNQKKKRLFARIIAGILIVVFILALFTSMFRVQAASPATTAKLQALQSFQVIYVIEGKQVPVGADAVNASVVTVANLDAIRADAASPSNAGSGKVVCAGVEMKLPAELYETDGYVTDAAGNLMISEAALYNYLTAVFTPFTTVGKNRYFTTSDGELIVIGGGSYGAGIDVTAEMKHIINCITNHVTEARFPVYTSKAFGAAEGSALPATYAEAVPSLGFLPVAGNALYDIGMTYVEINLNKQKLYYYKNGDQVLSTDIVTGDVRLKRETPTGVFALYGKQTNRTLRGADYEAFVKYWMPVYGNIGMHDASWRGKFGGSIYETNGSHGCINLPSTVAKQLYEGIAIGTPVIVY